MASIALLPVNSANAAAGAYGLYLSAIAIRNVRAYEDATKRAARWTQMAADQLKYTRTTCAAGAIASLYALLASAYPLIATQASGWQIVVNGAFRAAVLVAARRHIAAFWGTKQKVPGVPVYNEAITSMTGLLVVMRWMVLGAVAEAGLGAGKMVLF